MNNRIPFTSFGEVKLIIGALNTANDFEDIKPSILLSVSTVTDVIGEAAYDLAMDHYFSNNYKSPLSPGYNDSSTAYERLDYFVLAIQRPLIFYAYERYSPYSDLETSNSGRKMVVTNERKNAFEWMIDNYDQGLNRDANQTLDLLIKYLDENSTKYVPWVTERDFEVDDIVTQGGNYYQCLVDHTSGVFADDLAADYWVMVSESTIIFKEWTESEQYVLSRECFVNSTQEFNRIYPIDNSRRFYIQVLPFIRKIERKQIVSRLTPAFAAEISGQILYNDLTADNQNILDLVRYAVVPLTMAEAVQKFGIRIFPDGVVQQFRSERMTMKASVTSAAEMRERLYAMFTKEGTEALKDLEAALTVKSNALLEETEEETQTLSEIITAKYEDQKFFRL